MEDGADVTDQAGLVTDERSTGRDNKKQAGKRWGRHAKPSLGAASASGRSGPGRLSEGGVDLRSECPFGAERGTERAALRRTFG